MAHQALAMQYGLSDHPRQSLFHHLDDKNPYIYNRNLPAHSKPGIRVQIPPECKTAFYFLPAKSTIIRLIYFFIFFRQHDPIPFPISSTFRSDIHCHVKHSSPYYAYQLSLRIFLLIMKAPQYCFSGRGLVILYKVHRKSGFLHVLLIISFHKVSPQIAMNCRLNHTESFYSTCIFFYFYLFILPRNSS